MFKKLIEFNSNKGQMLVEILLVIAITAIMLPALLTGLISSKQGKAQQGQRVQAIALMREGVEILRNLKEQSWSYIATAGTYYPEITDNNWSLASGSENIGTHTREIEITDVYRDSAGNIVTSGGAYDPSTKRAVITVSWGTPLSSNVSSTLYFTRYANNESSEQTTETDFDEGDNEGTIVTNVGGGEVTLEAGGGGGDWCNPSLSVTEVDLSRQGVPTAISAYQGTIVTGTGGNASGPTFVRTSVSGNEPPTTNFVGEFDNSKANAVFTENNRGYIATDTNSEEFQILDLTQFTDSPANTKFLKTGYFDAPGNGDGLSVYVVGGVGYAVSDNTFYTFDLTSHTGSRPALNSGLTLSGNGVKIVVVGSYAYVATNSTTTQLQVIDVSNPTSPAIVASFSAGNSRAGTDVSVNSSGTRAYLATENSSTAREFFIINTEIKSGSLPAVGTGFDTSGMSPRGISVGTGNKIIVVGTGGTYQYQVVDISNELNPSLCGTLQIPAGANAVSSLLQDDGYAYSYVVTGDANAELKIVLGGAGGQFAYEGTFTSGPIDPGSTVNFNYFSPIFITPPQTSLTFQVAIANAVNDNCDEANYFFVGPDGTENTFYTGEGAIPTATFGSYQNPGRCLKYQANFTTSDTSVSPTLEGVLINFSP